jgi:glycine oxidase
MPVHLPIVSALLWKEMQIAVVGGGIVGCAAAWRLAQRGAEVVVYDQGRIGGEASWAGAGMLAPGGEFGEDSRWGRLGVESLRLYPGFVAELEQASGVSIDFRVCGAEEVAASAEEVAAVEDRIHRQERMGIPVEALGPGRWLYPEEAMVNPRDVVAALRRAGAGLGVVYREQEAVTDLDGLGADAVVYSPGAWAMDGFPVKGHLIRYQLAPGSLPRIVRGGHFYVLQRRSGETIAGADMEQVGFDRALRPAAVEEIRQAAERLVPELVGQPVVEVWNGFRPGHRSGEPVVGRRGQTRIWDAYGHFRNGILLAPITARLLSSSIFPSSERD